MVLELGHLKESRHPNGEAYQRMADQAQEIKDQLQRGEDPSPEEDLHLLNRKMATIGMHQDRAVEVLKRTVEILDREAEVGVKIDEQKSMYDRKATVKPSEMLRFIVMDCSHATPYKTDILTSCLVEHTEFLVQCAVDPFILVNFINNIACSLKVLLIMIARFSLIFVSNSS